MVDRRIDYVKEQGATTKRQVQDLFAQRGIRISREEAGDLLSKAYPKAAAEAPATPKIAAAAYLDASGKVHTGANHPEILNRLGVKGFEERDSRNTPQFGYVTDQGQFVTRAEAVPIIEKSGQKLEEFETPGQPHSDEIEHPAKPGKPLSKGPAPAETGGEITGMGGATPKEFEPVKEFTTSNKNSVVDKERGSPTAPVMEPARRGDPVVWDDAMKMIDNDPELPARLTRQIIDSGRMSGEMNLDTQNAILLHRRIDLHNSLNKALNQLNQHMNDSYEPGIEESRLRAAQLSDNLMEVDSATKLAGTELGRGLRARQVMAREDYSLAAMESRLRGAKSGNILTDQERTLIKGLHDKIEE